MLNALTYEELIKIHYLIMGCNPHEAQFPPSQHKEYLLRSLQRKLDDLCVVGCKRYSRVIKRRNDAQSNMV